HSTDAQILVEDVNPSRSFEENVQHIFFRVIKNGLKNYRKSIINEEFNQAFFLESFDDTINKDFWEKIVNTQAFEMFIMSNTHLDDSNTKIFNNILELRDDSKYLFLFYRN